MFNIQSLATMAAAATLISPVVGVFDANSNANMAVYWGQGPYQKPLSHFCADPHIDIINIAFLNQFPDQTHGYPGFNFGNQCGNATYTNKDGTPSKLLSDCPLIGNDIKTCQQAGKKVLLSLGGAIPSDQTVKDDVSAENFASFLWDAFGPNNEFDSSTPRPFGDAVVDGFDLDIESAVGNGVTTADLSAGYSSLISDLRVYFRLDPSKTYYISGAPQCVVPDAHLADAIETASFDFLFVQFYNTPTCSARSYYDHSYGGAGSNITFDAWVNFVKTHGANKHTKIYLGLPGSADANVVIQPEMYLNVTEARGLVAKLQCTYPDAFGGVMIYEATASETNSFGGAPYCDVVKKDMVHNGCSNKKPNPTTSSATSSSFSAGVSGASSASSGLSSGLAPPSSSPPYPMSSGSVPSRSIPSGSAFPSGSARASGFVSSTGSASATSKIGTAPYSYSASVVPSGASTGVSQSALASVQSSVPYPMSNGSSPLSTGGTASAGTASGKVVSLTDVVTITSCAPEVTNCPARTKPVISTEVRVSIILPGSSASQPSGEASAASSTPANSPQSTQEVVTTVITTSYLTTCPVTQTATSGGSQIIKTGSTVSTVFSTITSTICTKCVAPPTPAPTQEGTSSSPAETTPALTQEDVSASSSESTLAPTQEGVSSTPGEITPSPSQKGTTGSPVPSASTQDVVTTEIVTSYLTTCPVTQTLTQGGSQVVQTRTTTSTIYSTITSTICTKCVAPPTPAPTQAATSTSPGESPATGSPAPSASTQEVVTTEIVTSYLTTCPVTQTVTQGGSQVIQTGTTTSTVYSTITSTICTKCVAPPTPAPTQTAGASSTADQSPVTGSPAPSASAQEVITTVIEYTTLTTCPVTNTITSGTSEIVQVTNSVSTITRTSTSTITVAAGVPSLGHLGPPKPVPESPANSGSNSSPPAASIASVTAQSPPQSSSQPGAPAQQAPANSPASGSSQPAAPAQQVSANSPAQSSSQPAAPAQQSSTSSPAPGVSQPAAPAQQSSASSPAPGVSQPAAPAQQAPANSPAQGVSQPTAPAQQAPATSPSQEVSQPAAAAQQAAENSAGQGGSQPAAPAKASPVQTLTMSIIPIPVNPSQTAKPQSPIESGAQANGSPSTSSSGSSAPANGASSGSNGAPAQSIPASGASSGSAPLAGGASSGSGAPVNAAPGNSASTGSGAPANAAPGNSASSGSGAPANAAPGNIASSGSGAPANAAPGNSASSGSSGSVPGSGIPGSPASIPAASGTLRASPSGSGSQSGNARSSPIAFQGAASKMNVGVFGMITFVAAAQLVL